MYHIRSQDKTKHSDKKYYYRCNVSLFATGETKNIN